MNLAIYQIDAFADELFKGNPAAVVPLDAWLDNGLMQAIAAENNLSETAYIVPTSEGFHIRWFTPKAEVKLCGHATLAAAFVIVNEMNYESDLIQFQSKSGVLKVSKNNDEYSLNFPVQKPEPCEMPTLLADALNQQPTQSLQCEDLLAVFDSEEKIRELKPNFGLLEQLDCRGIIATAPSNSFENNCDFVVRFFAPRLGILEDPVTGSAYTKLTPYWVEVLGREKLYARQLSSRGGYVTCELKDDRVFISGKAVKYMEGTIQI